MVRQNSASLQYLVEYVENFRAEARRLLGDIEGAARDCIKALSVSDEPGIEQRVLDGLEAIDRPTGEDME